MEAGYWGLLLSYNFMHVHFVFYVEDYEVEFFIRD